MTISPPSVLSGGPAHLTCPPRVDSAGPEAVALAAAAGLHLDPWQQEVLEVALGESADGRWAAREVGLVVPRQNGKGAILEALIAAALLLFDERLILYSAHEFKTAEETFRRVRSLMESTPDLDRLIKSVTTSNGKEAIELRNGGRLRFVARSKGSGRGFSPERIILDEALNLSTKAVSALLFSMSAQTNPQLWYTSSAPDDSTDSAVLRRLMRRGRDGDEGLAYVEYCADDDADLDDEQAWARANPGFPHRISAETIRTERRATEPQDFLRERLGVVDLDTGSAPTVIPPMAWQACADTSHKPSGEVRFALDVDTNSSGEAWATIAKSDGTHVEIVKTEKGTAWVVPVCVEKKRAVGKLLVAKDSPAAALTADLEAAGVTVQQVQPAEFAQASMQFFDAVGEGSMRHLDQPELNTAVARAARKDVGDGQWRWSRKLSHADVGPLCAVSMARWARQARRAPVFAY